MGADMLVAAIAIRHGKEPDWNAAARWIDELSEEELERIAGDVGWWDDDDTLVAYLSDPEDAVPVVDKVDGGAWVRAWLWVPDEAVSE